MEDFQIALETAVAHHLASRFDEADPIYRQLLVGRPRHADVLHLFGIMNAQRGTTVEAAELIARAAEARPASANSYWTHLGNALLGSGYLKSAVEAFQKVSSDQFEAQFKLGLAFRDLGQLESALEAFRRASTLDPADFDAPYEQGNALSQLGRYQEAVDAYDEALRVRPDEYRGHNNRANALYALRRFEESAAACRRALEIDPDGPQAYANLGSALKEMGQFGNEAIKSFRRALALDPDSPQAQNNLGVALQDAKLFQEALQAMQRAIALNPNLPEAHYNLGVTHQALGNGQKAVAAFGRAIELKPDYPEAYYNLGIALKATGDNDAAMAAYREAIRVDPNSAQSYNNLGVTLTDAGRIGEATEMLRKAIELQPDYSEAHYNLGIALKVTGGLDAAIASYRKAIEFAPNSPRALSNLGVSLMETGLLEEALACFRKAIALNPDFAIAHSNLVYTMYFAHGYDCKALYEEHVSWARHHAPPMKKHIRPHDNDRSPGKRLRIGYVSPDFRLHPVGRFLLPLLAHHDHENFEIIAYSSVAKPDAFTKRLRAEVDVWHDITALNDLEAVEKIRQDGVDILIDLTMHMSHNRMPLFCAKPAPVQASYLAILGTTGLDTMDYRISDPYVDPPPESDEYFTEKTWRLAHSCWCFEPLIMSPPVSELPALSSGTVTFGCFNNFAKSTLPTLQLWASLLQSLPNSQIAIHANPGKHQIRLLEIFAAAGVSQERVRFFGSTGLEDYLAQYGQVDIALDPFPYSGGTTTCDALWMGVPVVALRGDTPWSRAGVSLLTNAGMPDWIASSPQEYLDIARSWARDIPRLANLRRGLREQMRGSLLMDAHRFAHDIEAAYRSMWTAWCEQN